MLPRTLRLLTLPLLEMGAGFSGVANTQSLPSLFASLCLLNGPPWFKPLSIDLDGDNGLLDIPLEFLIAFGVLLRSAVTWCEWSLWFIICAGLLFSLSSGSTYEYGLFCCCSFLIVFLCGTWYLSEALFFVLSRGPLFVVGDMMELCPIFKRSMSSKPPSRELCNPLGESAKPFCWLVLEIGVGLDNSILTKLGWSISPLLIFCCSLKRLRLGVCWSPVPVLGDSYPGVSLTDCPRFLRPSKRK